jgi:hypothetical protein
VSMVMHPQGDAVSSSGYTVSMVMHPLGDAVSSSDYIVSNASQETLRLRFRAQSVNVM